MEEYTYGETIAQINTWRSEGKKIYLTSGGFDPLHIGHTRCILETSRLAQEDNGKVVVLVNADNFLIKKKGSPFMPELERVEIISSIRGVDLAVIWRDRGQTVSRAIEIFRPDYFTKGGDRMDASTIPEWEVCQSVGCKVLTGIGGDKIQSSSELIRNSRG
jgi:D-beta-D-heptose 7-phosphate kinase/D-beta-D-heptose 1-phosphate adenosyltransferase